MPTTSSRARRWMEQGKAVARWSDLGVFYVQLVNSPSGYEMQPVNIGIDPGKRYSGVAVQSQKYTLGMFHLVLMGFILLSISDANWKRIGQRAISKCRLIARSTGLVISGGLTPNQPPLLSLPAV